MNRVVHFEFVTDDPQAEVDFFTAAFGWTIERWGEQEYWLVGTGLDEPGIDGAIMTPQAANQQRVVNTIEVADLEESMKRAMAAGASMAGEAQEVENVGWVAYLLSPTGILFGMIQSMSGGGM